MAEVNTGGGHDKGKKKTKQKKVDLRVDFTPMVDMNMLLITFFMFCTSLSKPQTMEINMPSRDKVVDGEETVLKESEAVTIIMGGDDKVFYYFGMIDEKGEAYSDPTFLKETNYSPDGLRAMLLGRNKAADESIRELKKEKLATQMADSTFNSKRTEIWKKPGTPKVMIKAMDEANYKNLIDVLDEMQICNVGVYAIVDVQEGDKFLVNKYLGLITDEDLKSK